MDPVINMKLEDKPSTPLNPKSDLEAYRNSLREQDRIRSLFTLVPQRGKHALDIGARDGFLSLKLADRYASVTALDLDTPHIDDARVHCVQGDITGLKFKESNFDLVLCAEVLEHIPTPLLSKACAEISRVARDQVVIGVPYRQDNRLGRTNCEACGGKNPPWGHVNTFDEEKLRALFPDLRVEKVDYVGETKDATNFISVLLMDLAGNPYGTYRQEEGCVHCGARLVEQSHRNFAQKVATFVGHRLRILLGRFNRPHPNWIHVLFVKPVKPARP